MSELERILPSDLTDAALASASELALPYLQAVDAIVVATRHRIAVLGLEAFEIRKDGLLTVNLTDASSLTTFTGDWKAYVTMMNAEADRWLKKHRFGGNHVYVLTSASEREFVALKGPANS